MPIVNHSQLEKLRLWSPKLWHYMSFVKYVALLAKRSLYFCNIDHRYAMLHQYEGMLPQWH